jgi:beta-aspartyl-peptidase (threonine type)
VQLKILLCVAPAAAIMNNAALGAPAFGIAIHGGAGTITRATMSEEKEKAYRAALTAALEAGYDILKAGGSSLDAVAAAIVVMEDCPLFNAGRGATFNAGGQIELDAAIMDGKTQKAGAVSAIRTAKNPILVARAVMEKTGHVMLTGDGAEAFARAQGFAAMSQEYFFTANRWESLQKEQERIRNNLPESESTEERKHGTVGAVALDGAGNLAAGTSTGGYTNKMAGRVGDTPVIGAGTYAANDACAVSATGHGEFFMRMVVAHDIASRMRYSGLSLTDAAHGIVMNKLKAIDASGGVIAIDTMGNIAMPFNTEGMYRGQVGADGEFKVEIYR